MITPLPGVLVKSRRQAGRWSPDRHARALAAASAALLALAGCGPLGSYAPRQDHSRFAAAALLGDGSVLFSFSHLVYRPATGITAFPDGGVPRYLADESILGTFHPASGDVRILRREKNERWSQGQGRYGIQGVSGTMAVVNQGGQLRRDLARTLVEHWLVDAATGVMQRVDWEAALAERGLVADEVRILDGRGTLLFVTRPLGEGGRPRTSPDRRLWARTAAGVFVEVAPTPHHERMLGDELVYWVPETRRFHAWHTVSGTTRELPGYRVPPYEDVTEGVTLDPGGGAVSFGRKSGDSWQYERLPLTAERVLAADR